MKPTLIKSALSTLIQSHCATFLWGAPGVGKSQVVSQVAEDHGLELRDVRAVLLDPVDLRGLPSVAKGQTKWNPPDFLPTKGQGVLFLDELNAAPAMVQAACYQLVLDRRLGDYQLPEGWAVVAAGNRETDRAVVTRMPSALANRFIHLDYEVDLEDWTAWALQAGIQTEVIAFVRFRPGLLHDFDAKARDLRAFPSPRSWQFASTILSTVPDKAVEMELLKGTLGEGAAAELMGFLKIYRNLPSPDAVLMDPSTAAVPTDPATLYALCGALARKASDANANRFFCYAGRLPPEFGVLMVRDATHRDRSLTSSRPFIEWASKNAHVML